MSFSFGEGWLVEVIKSKVFRDALKGWRLLVLASPSHTPSPIGRNSLVILKYTKNRSGSRSLSIKGFGRQVRPRKCITSPLFHSSRRFLRK
jgi:hypothetical protein